MILSPNMISWHVGLVLPRGNCKPWWTVGSNVSLLAIGSFSAIQTDINMITKINSWLFKTPAGRFASYFCLLYFIIQFGLGLFIGGQLCNTIMNGLCFIMWFDILFDTDFALPIVIALQFVKLMFAILKIFGFILFIKMGILRYVPPANH